MFLKFIYFCTSKTLYMFQTGFLSIIRSTKLHIPCCRLKPATRIPLQPKCLTLYVQFCAPDDGQKTRLKHVQRLNHTEINKFEKRCILLVIL